MKKLYFAKTFGFAAVVTGLFSCIVCTPSHISHQLTAKELAMALQSVTPWRDEPARYSKHDWIALVSAAKTLQTSSPASVEHSIKEFQGFWAVPPANSQDSKLFLLLRVAFEVPESEPDGSPGQELIGAWFSAGTQTNSDMTVNRAWPLSWRNGNPTLLSGFRGYQGARYDAAREYRFFTGHYKKRNLNDFLVR